MTREEAIRCLEICKKYIDKIRASEGVEVSKELCMALDMAIKSLEQKPINSVLDKIRAEIKHMDFDFGDFYDHTDQIIEKVCEVIDKCRAESEV